jgi:hypothetical protein
MYLRHDPGFDNLHDDPRFAQLESRIGFPAEIRTVVKAATSAESAARFW